MEKGTLQPAPDRNSSGKNGVSGAGRAEKGDQREKGDSEAHSQGYQLQHVDRANCGKAMLVHEIRRNARAAEEPSNHG
jgi:hypothetical protein